MVIPESGWGCVPMHGGECHMGSARVPGRRGTSQCVYVRGLKWKGGWNAGGRRKDFSLLMEELLCPSFQENLPGGPGPQSYSLWLISVGMWEGRSGRQTVLK